MEKNFQTQVIIGLLLMPGLILLPYLLIDSPIKKTAYSIRSEVLEEIPLRSSKQKVFEFLSRKRWRNWSLGKGTPTYNFSYADDILVFDKNGAMDSNYYYRFKKENNFIKVDLGSYPELRKSWNFLVQMKVSLYFLFLDEELVQVRAVKTVV